MPIVRRNEPIDRWDEGDFVHGFVLLRRKESRVDRNGRQYFDLDIADRSGGMAAKVWPDSDALKGDYAESDFVLVKGTVQRHRNALQLVVDHCRAARDADRGEGFDPAILVPTSPEDLGDLWRRLEAIYPAAITRPSLRRLAEIALERWGDRLREHPAAKSVHHAYRGGLLEHTVAMAELTQGVCGAYRDIDRDLVLLGVLFHDIGKLYEIGAMPANDYTLEGQLLGHVVIGRDMLLSACGEVEGFPEDLRLHLEHLVLSHQGLREYGSPVVPMTPEAIVLHSLDDLDSKLAQLRAARRDGGKLVYLRPMARTVYLESAGREEATAVEPEPRIATAVTDGD